MSTWDSHHWIWSNYRCDITTTCDSQWTTSWNNLELIKLSSTDKLQFVWVNCYIRIVFTFTVIRHLSTPIFVMVSQWDSYQLKELNLDKYRPVQLPPSSNNEALYLAQFGNNTYKSIRRVSCQPWIVSSQEILLLVFVIGISFSKICLWPFPFVVDLMCMHFGKVSNCVTDNKSLIKALMGC
jgi:hypothetical protein